MRYLSFLLVTILLIQCSCTEEEPVLKIGLIADPQYADQPTAGKRHYRESIWKLEEAIDTFNRMKVDFIQNLGDVIDKDWRSFDSILPIYKNLNPGIENYHLLGNHEFSIDSSHQEGLLTILDMPDYYYSYVKADWRFIVLDATDYTYFSNSLHQYDIQQIDAFFNLTKDRVNNHNWNGAVGDEQQKWLRTEIDLAESLGQQIIVFSHMPVCPLSNAHNLWNNHQIIEIIESSPNVKAYINGHNHAGDYVYKNGIHYITCFGMVDTEISSFGILELFDDRMILKGYGNQKELDLEILN